MGNVMERLGSEFEQHTMKEENFEKYKNNKLIKQILSIKEIDGKKLFYTIRNNDGKECIGIYVDGIATYLILEKEEVFLKPNKMVSLPKEYITNSNMYKEQMKKIIDTYKKYQCDINEMKEKVFQHHLTENINDVKCLSEKYGEITIIDEELFIYLTKNKKRGNARGRVDLVGVDEKGQLLFIEVKIDGSVILGKNGINKHCYDIMQYCENAKYKKEDLNKWICQLNELFGKNIPLIEKDNPNFIILCGYNIESKYDVVDQIAAIISSKELDTLKENSNYIQVEKDNPSTIKTLKQHFIDIKKNKPLLILSEVKDNKVIKDFKVTNRRINYENKSWYIVRESLIKLTKEEK